MSSISLIGDSVLDNFYWLENKQYDLTHELRQKGYMVQNLAVDESRLDDVINGMFPRNVYSQTRHYPYPYGKVEPLKLLTETPTEVTVLSIGGNDLRVNIANAFFGVDTFINSVFTVEFVNKFEYVIGQILQHSRKLVLLIVYCPYIGSGSPYAMLAPFSEQIFHRVRNLYYGLGRQHNIPVLDLSKTFDPHNREHYGSTVIEPSNLSNKKIADCIDHIVTYYEGFGIYSGWDTLIKTK